MKLSVLHISDLHRDPESPLRNPLLLESLKRDRDRYTSREAPRIKLPDLIIVTGDLIQGVRHDAPGGETALQSQYDEALDFLTGLSEEFVEGDKRRVIVVPGNHDVSAYHSRQCLAPIDMATGADAKLKLVKELFRPESRLRWSWTDLALYEIVNPEMYKQRLAAFVDFYGRFYDGQRTYSSEPEEQFDVFDFPDWGITLVGFSSCHNNDLLNKQGAIHPDCIAHAGERLRAMSNESRLRIAVWHHNIEGSPFRVDYMDPETVQNFIDGGFSLGFHGHQHRPQYLNTRFRYGSDSRITVISAGTLCGGAASGFRRSYNLVEFDTDANSGCLHIREMQNNQLQMPIWGPGAVAPGYASRLKFGFDAPPQPFGRADHSTGLLARAAEFYENHQYCKAVGLLISLAGRDELARRLLLESLIQLGDGAKIAMEFDPPTSAAEAIALMDALWDEGEHERLAEILTMPIIGESTDGSVVEIRTKYEARLGN